MTTPKQSSTEIARLKIGGPTILSAEIPIRSSILGPLATLFRRRPHEQLIQVACGTAIVHVTADDAGTADFYFVLVNMTDRQVRVEHLYLEYLWMAGYGSYITQPLFTPPEEPVPPYAVKEMSLRVPLNSAAIRELMTHVQRAENTYSTPGIELTVGGRIALGVSGSLSALQRRRPVQLPFKVSVKQPRLHFSNPSARTGS